MGLIVENVNFSKKDIFLKKYVDKSIIQDIKDADIVLLPNESDRNGVYISYPEGTIQFETYLSEKMKTKIEYAVLDDDFQILQLHSVDVVVPIMFIAQNVLLPIVVDEVYNFAKTKIMAGRTNIKSSNSTVELELFKEDSTGVQHIKYKGPIDGLKELNL